MKKKTTKQTPSIKILDDATLAAATGGKMTYEWCQKAASFEFWVSYYAMDCDRFE